MVIISAGCSDYSFNCMNVSTAASLVLVVNNILSAYAMHWFSLVAILPLKSMFFSIVSITVLNMLEDSGSPCLTPESTVNSSLKSLCNLILTLLFVNVSADSLIHFTGTLYCLT
jgi:hypothetical protein